MKNLRCDCITVGERSENWLLSSMQRALGDCACLPSASVLRHLGIDPLRPSRDSAGQVMHLCEAGLLQECHRFRAASAHLAMGHDLAAAVQFTNALRQIAEWDEISIQVTDLVFVRLAHVENKDIGLGVEPPCQL